MQSNQVGQSMNPWHDIQKILGYHTSDVVKSTDSAFYPLWDGKTSTSQRSVMLCGWGVKAGMV